MKNVPQRGPLSSPDNNDHSNSTNTKFIRKTNSQAFNSFQNMLKYKANTED